MYRWGLAKQFFSPACSSPGSGLAPPYRFDDAFGHGAEGLVGREVGPDGSAFARVGGVAGFGFFQAASNLLWNGGFEGGEPFVDFPEIFVMRIAPGLGEPVDSGSEVGDLGEVVSPEIVYGSESYQSVEF